MCFPKNYLKILNFEKSHVYFGALLCKHQLEHNQTLTLVWLSVVVWQQSDLDLFVLVKQLFLRLHLRFVRHG